MATPEVADLDFRTDGPPPRWFEPVEKVKALRRRAAAAK
jgi:hypothetical protein